MRHLRALAVALPLLATGGCDRLSPLSRFPAVPLTTLAAPQDDGTVVDPRRGPDPVSIGERPLGAGIVRQDAERSVGIGAPPAAQPRPEGDISLNYVDADIREIARAVLGSLLGVNYVVEPGVQGTATIQTPRPVRREDLLAMLQAVLVQNGASLSYQGGLYRVGPGIGAATPPGLVGGGAGGVFGSQVVMLRYASAKQLVTVLEPFSGESTKIIPDPARNALLVVGSGQARQTIVDLVRAFDVDLLAGQTYALYPVRLGDPAKLATDLQRVLGAETDGALAGVVRVFPIERANAVLVVAPSAAYLDRASRFIAQLDRVEAAAGRNLRIYFVQNGQAGDLQPVLARAFGASGGGGLPGGLPPTAEGVQLGALGIGGQAGAGDGFSSGGNVGLGAPSGGLGGGRSAGAATGGGQGSFGRGGQGDAAFGQPGGAPGDAPQPGGAPDGAGGPGGGPGGDANGLRIIADRKRNALLVHATDAEHGRIEAAIRRLDVLPLQVLIEATIAEVSLNDALRFGTQFYFRSGTFNFNLSEASTSALNVSPGTAVDTTNFFGSIIAPQFPGFAVSRTGNNAAQFALQALSSVTDVRVVSSPKLLVLDAERARLQVGNLVPVLSQSSQSTVGANSPIVNSVEYRETGVILNVVPRVNAGGLVSLDIEQEVSDVVTTTTSTINSPTFQQRRIRSRIVVQDGDTIGLGGLIRDNRTNANSGIPLLKDIPGIGFLFSRRDESVARTELLVLLTPRVIRDQRDARVLTEELRRQLGPASGLIERSPPSLLLPSPAAPSVESLGPPPAS